VYPLRRVVKVGKPASVLEEVRVVSRRQSNLAALSDVIEALEVTLVVQVELVLVSILDFAYFFVELYVVVIIDVDVVVLLLHPRTGVHFFPLVLSVVEVNLDAERD
jgi:hypothetical protein